MYLNKKQLTDNLNDQVADPGGTEAVAQDILINAAVASDLRNVRRAISSRVLYK